MGKGIALQFRREFSEDYFKDYKRTCQSGELAIGKVHVYEFKTSKFDALVSASSPRLVVNFPTKNHWRGKSRIADIEAVCRVWLKQSSDTKSNQWRCPRSAADLAVWIGMMLNLLLKRLLSICQGLKFSYSCQNKMI